MSHFLYLKKRKYLDFFMKLSFLSRLEFDKQNETGWRLKSLTCEEKTLEGDKLCPARRHPKTFRGIRCGVLPKDQKRRESLERTTKRFVKTRIAARATLFFLFSGFPPHLHSHCYAKCDHRWKERALQKVIQATNQERCRSIKTFLEFCCQNCFSVYKV